MEIFIPRSTFKEKIEIKRWSFLINHLYFEHDEFIMGGNKLLRFKYDHPNRSPISISSSSGGGGGASTFLGSSFLAYFFASCLTSTAAGALIDSSSLILYLD